MKSVNKLRRGLFRDVQECFMLAEEMCGCTAISDADSMEPNKARVRRVRNEVLAALRQLKRPKKAVKKKAAPVMEDRRTPFAEPEDVD